MPNIVALVALLAVSAACTNLAAPQPPVDASGTVQAVVASDRGGVGERGVWIKVGSEFFGIDGPILGAVQLIDYRVKHPGSVCGPRHAERGARLLGPVFVVVPLLPLPYTQDGQAIRTSLDDALKQLNDTKSPGITAGSRPRG